MLLSDTNVVDSGFVISAIRILDDEDIVTTYVLPCICIGDADQEYLELQNSLFGYELR